MSLDRALAHLDAAPGKRLRPRLMLAAARAVDPDAPTSSPAAEALELIHTYSLVHDDLPTMDDDDLRRGQATLHVAFDEATAILVGDGLQTRAFELIATDSTLRPEQRVELIACLARAAGFEGMVRGQALDIQATDRSLDLEELKAMHALKTGALITAALEMGAIVGNADAAQRDILRDVGTRIGLAFQIIDDVIDVRSDSTTLGKTSGKDAEANKSTYVRLLGLDAAEAEANRLYEESRNLIADWGEASGELRDLLAKMVRRDR